MKAYSSDLRGRILKDCDAGMGTREVATKYSVSESWVRRLKQRRRETGETTPRRSGSRKEPIWKPHAERLRQAVAERPDATLHELRESLQLDMSITTIARALVALQLTFKKKSFAPRSRTGRTFSKPAASGEAR